ncbi:zinc c3hc4 type (ring finger) protein [Cystoisospora suis]|uniref:Zinc c3hc4 type (Ring finger) protein n=1 Tax=Cystoisospora suis TaxID=483139 RepID=A0A2C6KF71_9APIC|nr:zinc c3hc4 type (ring finger) protein [Cystoisospora suis]
MCGERGHHIRNCSRSNDPRHQKKVRPATGIPSSFLRDISVDDIPKYAEVYIRKDGSFAVMKDAKQLSSLSYFSSDLDTKIERHVGSSDVAAHLKCPICHHLFSQPVATPCCGESFCRNCLTLAVDGRQLPGSSFSAKSTGCCPSCGKSIDLREVLFNTALQKSVDAIVHSNSSFRDSRSTFSQAGSVLPDSVSSLSTAPPTTVVAAAAVSAAGPGIGSVEATASSAPTCASATSCVKGVKGELPGQSTFTSQVTSSVAAACVKKEKDEELNSPPALSCEPQTIAATKTGEEGSLVKAEDQKKQEPAEPTQYSGVKAGSLCPPVAAVTNGSAAVSVANGSPAGDTHSGHVRSRATACHESKEAKGEEATGSGNGRKTDVQSGLPIGINLKQLQQQQDFAAAYIEQYLQRKQKKRRKAGSESDKSSEKSDSDKVKNKRLARKQ